MKRAMLRRLAALTLSLPIGLGLLACEKPTETVDPEPVVDVKPEVEPAIEWPDEPCRAERPKPKPIKDTPIPAIDVTAIAAL